MKKWLSIPLLCISLAASCQIISTQPSSALIEPIKAVHHIEMNTIVGEGGTCSATAVGKHTLLTAGHCIIGGTDRISIDDSEGTAAVTGIVYDDKDHALVTVDATFDSTLPIEERAPLPNEHVRIWGYPGNSDKPVYREGHYIGKKTPLFSEVTFDLWKLPIYPGDSGSALVTDDNKIITVASMGDKSADAATFDMNFTPQQLQSIK